MSATAEAVSDAIANSGPAGEEAPAGDNLSSSPVGKGEASGEALTSPDRFSSPAERAVNRAKARIEAAQAQENSSSTASEQAASGDAQPQDGDSTQNNDGGALASEDQPATGGESGVDSAASTDSTVSAPQDWPSDIRAKFDALPDDGVRKMVLDDLYKPLQAGFTKSMQSMAQERELAREYSNLRSRFDAGPDDAKTVLQELASAKGIEIYFDAPESAGELPEFNSTAEMLAYFKKETDKQVRQALASRDAETNKQQTQVQLVNDLRSQFENLSKDSPDWVNYKDAIVERLRKAQGNMTASEAYALETLPRLRDQAAKVTSLQAENSQLKGEIEKAKKRATHVPPSDGGQQALTAQKNQNLSRGQRAYQKAAQRVAKSHAK